MKKQEPAECTVKVSKRFINRTSSSGKNLLYRLEKNARREKEIGRNGKEGRRQGPPGHWWHQEVWKEIKKFKNS